LHGVIESRDRTAELVKARDAAEDALEVKATFMANMSHELRTPMNSVIGFTSLLLLDEQLTFEQKDYIEIIRNSGESLLALINEVLDFSKLEQEKTDLELQPFNLRTIVEESLDLVSTKAAEKDLELIYTFGKGALEAIVGDPGKLRQVMANLLSNAVKFTKEGEVVVEVTSDPAQSEVHVAVRDTGIGIPQEDMGKLFQPHLG
jgi:signal transduction histidine kinase